MNFIPVIRIEDVFCYLTVYSVMSTSHVKGTEHPWSRILIMNKISVFILIFSFFFTSTGINKKSKVRPKSDSFFTSYFEKYFYFFVNRTPRSAWTGGSWGSWGTWGIPCIPCRVGESRGPLRHRTLDHSHSPHQSW